MNDPRVFLTTCATPGWDSYEAEPVTAAAVRAASGVQFVPTVRGGVQAEWADVEVEFDAEGRVVDVVVDRPRPWAGKDKNPAYEPTSDEARLSYLVEEAGEMLAAAGKTLRYGLASYNPEPGSSGETNAAWLTRELADLKLAIELVERYTL